MKQAQTIVAERNSRLRWLPWSLAALGGAAWGIYRWQPLRYDFLPSPLPQEHLWMDPDSEQLFRPGARVAIVTAHPDDSEFYLGGLLTRLSRSGAHLQLIVATDGDKGYYPFADAEANRRIRRQEQREAAQQWNAEEVVFLGYPDGRLRVTPELVRRIAEALQRFQPDSILLFDAAYPPRLTHQDHLCAGIAAEQAARQVHAGRWLLHFSTLAPNFAVDVTAQWADRLELLRIHKSQFHDGRLQTVTRLITRNAITDGKRVGAHYAEGLRCVRLP